VIIISHKIVIKHFLTACFFILMHIGMRAQVADEFLFENASVGLKDNDLKLLKEGRVKFIQFQYLEALALFESISVKEQPYLDYLKGICYSHDPNNVQKALALLSALKDKEVEITG
jgi:hypothetical protein